MKLSQIEKEIKKMAPHAPMKRFHFSNPQMDFLCVYIEGSKQFIRLFDENHGLDIVSSIGYRINSNSCFISSFETLEELQGLGLGRFVYNMALAHADMQGAKSSYGDLSPTNSIKGVSAFGEEHFSEEIEALIQIYSKLGNNLDVSQENGSIRFSSSWNAGDRIKLLSNEQLELLQEISPNKNNGLGSN